MNHSEMAKMVPGVLIPKPCLKDANPKMILTILKLQKHSKIKFKTLAPNLRRKLAYQLFSPPRVFCCSVKKPEG